MSAQTMLVVPAWYPTEREPLSGPFVRDHTRAAAAYGHRMVVLVDCGPSRRARLVHLEESRDGPLRLVLHDLPPTRGSPRGRDRRAARGATAAQEGTPVDVLHAHIHRMGWVAVLAGDVLRRPVVITENSSEWPRHLMSPGRLRRAKFALEDAALVCPVNLRLQQAIESYGVRARFRIVPNTVDASVFRPGPAVHDGLRLVNVADMWR